MSIMVIAGLPLSSHKDRKSNAAFARMRRSGVSGWESLPLCLADTIPPHQPLIAVSQQI